MPGRVEQAQVLRDFVSRAEAYGIDYNIVEAIDQPWKTIEGGVGPYWGLFDASRQPKFDWTGPISDPDHWKLAGIALLVSVLLSLPLLAMSGGDAAAIGDACRRGQRGRRLVRRRVRLSGTDITSFPARRSRSASASLLLIPLIIIALARIDELAAIAFGRKPLRLIEAPPLAPDARRRKCRSIFRPIASRRRCSRQTLDAVARLDYPNFECVVVINNTPDPALWRPVEEHCRALGERFKFVNAENLQGFKAGALRLAMVHTAADAEVIGVIDADYVVAARLAQGTGAAIPPTPRSAWCRRRRITATAAAASCTTP